MKTQSKLRKFIKENYVGYILITPLILGLLFFTVYPVFSSLYYSFYKYDFIGQPKNFVGFANYIYPFKDVVGNKLFTTSASVTLIFTIITIPVTMFLSFLLANLLNVNIKGIKLFRTLFYLPVLIPTVVTGIVWKNIFNPSYGIANQILQSIGFPKSEFFNAAASTMPTFIFMQLFGLGGSMILWLAALKSIPATLYEAAKIDGASKVHQFFYITVPMSTPYIFYMLITGIIGTLQTFGGPFVLLNGTAGREDSLLFFVMNIYNEAFNRHEVGIASALSWILFLVIGLLTLAVFKTSKWVYYGEEQ